MAWETYYPDSPNMPEFSFVENTVSIELTDWKSIGILKNEFPLPPGNGYAIEVVSDAPASWGNRVGVLAGFKESNGEIFCEIHLEPEIQENGNLTFFCKLAAEREFVSVVLQPYCKWNTGKVTFSGFSISPWEPPPPRIARIAVANISLTDGENTKTQRMARLNAVLEKIQADEIRPDLILFSETIADVELDLTPEERFEAIPDGPTASFFASWSKKLHCYIAGGIHELCDGFRYNTAVITGRNGEFIGKYHKVNPTWGDSRNGIIPGNTHPVFKLDFGNVGFSICWDNWFGENARKLRLNGAELMLVPIAGDGIPSHRDMVWGGRAAENAMAAAYAPFYDVPDNRQYARIYDCEGKILASTTENNSYIYADIDFSKRIWIERLSVPSRGEGRSLYIRERRDDLFPMNTPESEEIL